MSAEAKSAGGEGPYRSSLRFAARYALFAGGLFALYAFPYPAQGRVEQWFHAYLVGYAHLVGWAVSAFDPQAVVQDVAIIGRSSVRIVKSCDAMEAKVLLASAILAFAGPLGRKLFALVAGIATLTLVNVLRIVTLYFLVARGERVFELFHLEIWPLLMILAAGLVFVLATRFLQAPPALAQDHGSAGV